jgi:hypothetical protein
MHENQLQIEKEKEKSKLRLLLPMIAASHLSDTLLPAVFDNHSRQLPPLDAPRVQTLGIRLEGQGIFRIMAVNHGHNVRLWVRHGTLQTRVQQRLMFIEQLRLSD